MRHPRVCVLPQLLPFVFAMAMLGPCSGCGAPPDLAEDETRVVEITELREAAAVRFDSGLSSRQRLVIRDPATWAATWSAMVRNDFNHDVVLVAAMGTRTSGGYAIHIDGARISDERLVVSVSEESPIGCAVTAALTAPVAVAVVPRFAGPTTFVEHTTQHACR